MSPRQRDTLALVCHDRGYKGAADALGLSPHTVRNTLRVVRERLGVETTFGACYRMGQADPPPGSDGRAMRAEQV